MASLAAIAQGPEETVQPPPPETYRRRPDGAVEISELWRILWHRRAMILAVAGLLTGLALAYGLTTSPLYTASTQLLIDPRDRNVVNNDVNPNTLSPDGGLAQIESQTSVIQSGGVLVREGDPGESFIVLLSGRAVVDQGGREIREMAGGDFLGEISLIDQGPRTATVTATEPVRALSISCQGFARLMDDYPPVRLEILSALTRRLRSSAPAVSN